jgi:hypothetical protein
VGALCSEQVGHSMDDGSSLPPTPADAPVPGTDVSPEAAAPPDSGAPPDPAPHARVPVRERLTARFGLPDGPAVALALLIAFGSILSAVVAWRASLASIDASRYASISVQQQARLQQIERDLQGLIAQDLRFVDAFQEHALAARELKAQADEVRPTDPVAADNLDLQAQAELDLTRGVEPFFLGASGPELNEDGTVTYDVAYVLQNLRESNTEWRELSTQRTGELAARADARSVSLIGIAALFVAALFLLTIAQVARPRAQFGRLFFTAGALLIAIGTFSFVVAELVA